jgi:hypothetical protein
LPSTSDQAELLHRLRLVVLEDLELVLLQVEDRLRLVVGGNHVHADEVDAAAEDRLSVLAGMTGAAGCPAGA